MSKEVKIGLVVLVALVGGIWGMNYLKGVNLFSSGETGYYSIYKNTAGLAVSSSVVYQGNKVGRVKSIELYVDSMGNSEAGWRIEFTVDNLDLFIPHNTIAEIGGSILSSKVIELKLGDSMKPAEEGSMLEASIQQDIAEQVTAELEPLKQSIEKLVGSVDKVVLSVSAIFEDDATQGLPLIFESLQRSMSTLEATFNRVDGMVEENRDAFGAVMSNVESITENFNDNSGALDTIINNFASISDTLAQIEFATIIYGLNQTMGELAEITDKINNGDGSLAKVLNSDSLIVEIEQTNQELQYLLNDIYTNPKKYLGFSVIGRKDRNGFSAREEERILELIKEEK